MVIDPHGPQEYAEPVADKTSLFLRIATRRFALIARPRERQIADFIESPPWKARPSGRGYELRNGLVKCW